MQSFQKFLVVCGLISSVGLFTTGCRKKYDNPITKDTQQPDKVLFDRAINDIEHGRFEVARLTLNTLINTYDSSEYLAKAKLAIADSWYREGGSHGLAQAEAEYKDFELFYPNMEESAEAQWRVCQIHYKQMEKVDRDNSQALRAEDECKQMISAYPNSRYTGQATQMLRNIQEVLADKEFRTADFYHTHGAYPAALARLSFVANQYPLYSGADDALWEEADSYQKLGDRYEEQQAAALSRIIKDYPLSNHVDEAKEELEAMKRPIPAADPAAYERMKWEQEAATKPGLMAKGLGFIRHNPDTHLAAKTGAPSMTQIRPPTPISVPAAAADTSTSTVGGVSDVTASQVTDTTTLDSKPDARAATAGKVDNPAAETPATSAAAKPAAQLPPPTNHPMPANRKLTKKQKKMLEQQQKQQEQQKEESQKQQDSASPAAATTPATPQQ